MSVQKLASQIDPNDRVAVALFKDLARTKARWDVLRALKGKKDAEAKVARQEWLDTRALLKKHVSEE